MKEFRNWRVGVKLVAGFLAVAAIAAVIGGLGLRSTSQVNQMAMLMYGQEVAGIRHASQAQLRLVAAGRAARAALLAPDKGARIGELYAMRDHLEGARTETEKLHVLMADPDGKEMVSNALEAIAAYAAALETYATQLEAAGLDIDSLQTLARHEMTLSQATMPGDLAEMLINGMVLNKQNTSSDLANETTVIYEQSLLSLGGLTALGACLAVVLGLLLARGLMRQLGGEPVQVVRVVNTIAHGDLTTPVDLTRARDGSVMSAMETMRVALSDAVGRVHASSDSIATGAHQIAVGNTDLARRTEAQVASLTQTAAAMEQLSSTVVSNADVSRQAAQMALTARQSAERGGDVVTKVMATMDDISQASRRVVDIIALIDSIAFQTNILALNAAVEAARAGEQGRGFAVVASEVRALAQKSASAASDIKTLITDSRQKVDDGSAMVTQAGHAMADIVQEVNRVADLIQDISQATHEQTDGIAQINVAVASLMQINHENATLVDQSASAAEGLSYQASHLLDAMGMFDLGTTGTATRATVASVEGWATPEELELIDQEAYAQRVSVPMAPRLSTATHGGYQPALA